MEGLQEYFGGRMYKLADGLKDKAKEKIQDHSSDI